MYLAKCIQLSGTRVIGIIFNANRKRHFTIHQPFLLFMLFAYKYLFMHIRKLVNHAFVQKEDFYKSLNINKVFIIFLLQYYKNLNVKLNT